MMILIREAKRCFITNTILLVSILFLTGQNKKGRSPSNLYSYYFFSQIDNHYNKIIQTIEWFDYFYSNNANVTHETLIDLI